MQLFVPNVTGALDILPWDWSVENKIRDSEIFRSEETASYTLPNEQGVIILNRGKLVAMSYVYRDGFICGVQVSKPYQGLGIGKLLMDVSESLYDARTLLVLTNNTVAQNLYSRSGWKICGRDLELEDKFHLMKR